jgi:hypothetical protein
MTGKAFRLPLNMCVVGLGFMGQMHARTISENERHGAVLALPEVVLMARPEGVEPPTI